MNKSLLRTVIIYALYIIVFSVIQLNYPAALKLFGTAPDFLLVFSAVTIYLYGTEDGIIISLIVGFIKDMFSGRLLGLGALLYLLCTIIAAAILVKFMSHGIFSSVFQVFIASAIYYSTISLVSIVFFEHSFPIQEYISFWTFKRILPGIMLNLLVSIPIYFIFKRISPYKEDNGFGKIEIRRGVI